jgi:type IV pilus assembly protein PilW
MKKNQQGFSLLEIIISLSVGLVLFAGVMSVFIGMRTTTAETNSLGALQENGRFALSVLTDDLMRQDFWGDLAIPLNGSNVVSFNLPGFPAVGDCIGEGSNNSSFPRAVGYFRTLWGMTVTADKAAIGCVSNAQEGSDILQIKRVLAQPLPPLAGGGVANPANDRFWLNTGISDGVIFPGTSNPPVINSSQLWEYQHHVYFVRNETQGTDTVPVLMQGTLSNSGGDLIVFQPLVDGIERIHFIYGVDTDNDRVINAYVPANVMSDDFWNHSGSEILAVRIYILARDISPSRNYTNDNSYIMGDLLVPAANDSYRRLLLTSTVTLHNSGMETW